MPATGETTPPAEPVPPKSTEEQLEDAAEKAARDALGGLFGRKRPATPEPEPEAEPEDPGAVSDPRRAFAGERHHIGVRNHFGLLDDDPRQLTGGAHVDDVAKVVQRLRAADEEVLQLVAAMIA